MGNLIFASYTFFNFLLSLAIDIHVFTIFPENANKIISCHNLTKEYGFKHLSS